MNSWRAKIPERALPSVCSAGHIASLAAALGGIDGIVITAGIGENAAPVRSAIGGACAWLGLELDERANRENKERISAPSSRVGAYVIKTDENLMIARHAAHWWETETPGRRGEIMSDSRDTAKPEPVGIPSAADIKRRMAEREAQKAAEELRRVQEQEEKQKAVMAEFHAPPDQPPNRCCST